MILDAYGRPVRSPKRLETPDWVRRDALVALATGLTESRVRALRESVGLVADHVTGAPITIRLPRHFTP